MKKTLKRILIISDDFHYPDLLHKGIEPGNIYYNDDQNWLRFKITLKETFKATKPKNFDAILIDYGFIGSKSAAIDLLQEAHSQDVPLAWVGGLPEHYNRDAQETFPKLKFIHNLPFSSIFNEDILFLLYAMFEEEKR